MTPKDIIIDFKAYRKKVEISELQMWKQGWYVKQALQSTVLVCGLADKKVIREMPKYPDMPKSDEEIENEKNKKAQVDLFVAKMDRWRKINNSKNKK